MIVFGTRPEAIKMAPICRRLRLDNDIETVVCVTGQHREMLDQVLELFKVKPDIDLDVMKQGQDLHILTAVILNRMRDVLTETMPDLVLVHGDTTTTMATSLACFYMGIEVGHVEAGLRTKNLLAPFPEEFNRQTTGLIAKYHFAPTQLSKQNLLEEGKSSDNILVTGNTVIDALHMVKQSFEVDPDRYAEVTKKLSQWLTFEWQSEVFILITGHRRENFGRGFLEICEAIKDLAHKHPAVHFVYPVHLNPNVQEPVNNILQGLHNVWLIDPLEYQEFILLLDHAYLVVTDSGGIQEEAPSLGKPVLVMREVTERVEAVEAGTVKLVGASRANIVSAVDLLLDSEKVYNQMALASNPYGDGTASEQIIEFIKRIDDDR